MKISIITVTYNCADTLEKTITSVLQQTYDNKEFLIIDGGSTDGTKDIIQKYSSSIDYWVSEQDDGLYYAMNKGIDVAKGDYLYFLNSGDILVTDILEYVARYIDLYDADIVYGDNYEGKNGAYRLENSQIECIDWKMNICHQSVFMKNKGLHFDTRYRIAADYELLNRLYNTGATFQYIPRAIVYFESGGLSSQWDKKKLEFAEIACRAQNKYGKCSLATVYIIIHNFIDAINRNLYVTGENRNDVIQYIKESYADKEAIIWGRGVVSCALLPAIKDAGIKIRKIIDNNITGSCLFEGIGVEKPEILAGEKNVNVFILSDRFCDEMYAQFECLNLDDSIRAIKFNTANDSYLDYRYDVLLEYAKAKYPYFAEMCTNYLLNES